MFSKSLARIGEKFPPAVATLLKPDLRHHLIVICEGHLPYLVAFGGINRFRDVADPGATSVRALQRPFDRTHVLWVTSVERVKGR